MIPITYNVRSLLARRSTTLAAALGIGLVVFVFAAVLMLSQGLDRMMKGSGSENNAIVLRKGSLNETTSAIPESAVSLLRAAPEAATQAQGTLSTAETAVIITANKSDGSGVSNVIVRGVTPESFTVHEHIRITEGRMPKPGTDEVIVGVGIAKRIANLSLNGEMQLKPNRTVKVVGLFEANGNSFESEVWGDHDAIRAIFNRQGTASSVTLRLRDPAQFEALKTRIAADPRLGLDVKREMTYYEDQSEGLAMFINTVGMLIAVFFSLGAMIGAMITMYAQVAQRGKEIGTLRALGFRRRSILLSFVIESVLLSLMGGALGILGALGMQSVQFSTLSFASFSEVVFTFTATPGILMGSLLFAAFMGLVGGLLPATRAARVSPIQAMRG